MNVPIDSDLLAEMNLRQVGAPTLRKNGVTSRLLRNPSALIGASVIVIVVAAALLSLVWTPGNPIVQSLNDALRGPSTVHLLGTDEFGRDELSRLMAGARVSLYAGIVAVIVASVLGVSAGLLGAVFGGITDEVVMRTADILFAFPALLAAVILVTVLGPSTTTAMVAIGLASVPYFARVTRSAALGVLATEFVLASRTYGRSRLAIVRRHVLPNIMSLLIVQTTLLFSIAILADAGLSYLGLGTPPPASSWGLMLQDGQNYLSSDGLLALWPALAIAITVLGFNLFGEGLRDILDPRLRPGA